MQETNDRSFPLDDYFRPDDLGLTLEQFLERFYWCVPYGDPDNPYFYLDDDVQLTLASCDLTNTNETEQIKG